VAVERSALHPQKARNLFPVHQNRNLTDILFFHNSVAFLVVVARAALLRANELRKKNWTIYTIFRAIGYFYFS
jgi:hypothetical protein